MIIGISAITEANRFNQAKIMNMLMLGAYLKWKPTVKKESILESFQRVLSEKFHHLLANNREALATGAMLVAQRKEQPVIRIGN